MRNLYIFAIGGSGERVLKSLILSLVSGASVNAGKIIPVFVDNDVKSDALTKCQDLIKYYNSNPQHQGVREMGAHGMYEFNNIQPNNFPSFCHVTIDEPIILNKAGGQIGNLQTIIGQVDKDDVLKDIAEERDLLFTYDDLQMPLNVGFVGNPNIGSVVLNSLSLSDQKFFNIYNSISNVDGVMVIGSLFGGTGAAGFPLIVNKFDALPPAKRPIIGGIAVLPYFSIKDGDKTKNILDTSKYDVNSDSFDAKTRAALMYYDEYMRNLDYLYYVGDGAAKEIYEHYVGGEDQINPSHIVELMCASSVIDFANQTRPNTVTYKIPIWGIAQSTNANGKNDSVSNIQDVKNSELRKALAKFEMMKMLFEKDAFIKWAIEENKEYVKNIGFTETMRIEVCSGEKCTKNSYAWGLAHLIEAWSEWIEELGSGASRRFVLYNEHAADINDGNIAQHFYTNTNDLGLAKTDIHKKGIFNKTMVTDIVPAEVSEFLLKAYKNMNIKGDENGKGIVDSMRLPLLLQIISVALDDVISNKMVL